jgi:stage II sporulation protein D
MPGGPFSVIEPNTAQVLVAGLETPLVTARFEPGAIVLEELSLAVPGDRLTLRRLTKRPFELDLEPGDWRRFTGDVELVRADDRHGWLVNRLDIEEYVAGVVAAELTTRFHPEAFRVQAIVARTYAWYQKEIARSDRPWDLTRTEASQVYAGLDRLDDVPQASEATRETAGIVCTWASPSGERIFCTYYSSTCGGSTQSAAAISNAPLIPPLLGGVVCPYCRQAPGYEWGPIRLSKGVITDRLRARYPSFESIGPIRRVAVVERTAAGRPVRLSCTDANGRSQELEVEGFRLAIDPTGRTVQSSQFRLRDDGASITLLNGTGFGHGVGLCQYGADELAREGKSAGAILRTYYPGCHLTRAY